MVSRFDDALLRDMIAAEQKYGCKLRQRRAQGILRNEHADVMAFYDQEIMKSDQRVCRLRNGPRDEESR